MYRHLKSYHSCWERRSTPTIPWLIQLIRFNNKLLMDNHIDYRNAKYQGQINTQGQRHGLGILIDDDLSFYTSHWKNGKLNDATLVYISHGKYIYGQWQNNQPHGLNVFRIGDTVILGNFNNGFPVNKFLIIFERVNFMAILEHKSDDSWDLIDRGNLRNYDELVKYIEKTSLDMKPHYFSLTKFLTAISDHKIKASPSRPSPNCYFGFESGLGIIFNPNNGVSSVGFHENKMIYEYGGKYEGQLSIEGNFQTNELIKFKKDRPTNQLYSIFQKMHKRSLNFKNQYFDSKVKLLSGVEELVREKINEIACQKQQVNQQSLRAVDLNDSLDYHAENIEELNKINQIREQVYESNKHSKQNFKKQDSKKISPCMTPKKAKFSGPQSPVFMKKSPSRKLDTSKFSQKSATKMGIDRSRRKSSSKTPIKQEIRVKPLQLQENTYLSKQFTYDKESYKVPKFHYRQEKVDPVVSRKQEDYRRSKLYEYQAEKQLKRESKKQDFTLKGPSYEDLSERRKRILKQFKELNAEKSQQKPVQNLPKKTVQPVNVSEYESPLMRERIQMQYSNNREISNEVMPLSIRKQNELIEIKKPQIDENCYTYKKLLRNQKTQVRQTRYEEVERSSFTPSKKRKYQYYFD